MQVHVEPKTAAELIANYRAVQGRLGIAPMPAPVVRIARPVFVAGKETRRLYRRPIGPMRPKKTFRQANARDALREDAARRLAMDPASLVRECTAGMPYLNRLIRPFVAAALVSRGRTWAEMVSHCRLTELNICRQEIMTILYGAGHSYATIGEWLNRDHSTILVGVRAHEKRLAAELARSEAQEP